MSIVELADQIYKLGCAFTQLVWGGGCLVLLLIIMWGLLKGIFS